MVTSHDFVAEFVRVARHELRQSHRKIRRAVGMLTQQQLWMRTGENENAAGNLLLHLTGSAQQWIVSGLGAEEDRRDRTAEFAHREAISAPVLLDALDRTMSDVDRVLSMLTSEQLIKNYPIQGFEVSGMYAVVHVVQHFGEHSGQIVWFAKSATGEDMGFFSQLKETGRATGGLPTVG